MLFGLIRFKQIKYYINNISKLNENNNIKNGLDEKVSTVNNYGLYFSIVLTLGREYILLFSKSRMAKVINWEAVKNIYSLSMDSILNNSD